ncbi:MAG: protein kinase [Nannocystaceae bacterium]
MGPSTSAIVVITALTEERDALLADLTSVEKIPIGDADSRVYFRGIASVTVDEHAISYSIIVVCLPNMGRVEAASATFDIVQKWKPSIVFLVGIAGGASQNDVAIGDVLIAQQIVDYEIQKIKPEGASARYQTYRVDSKLYNVCQNILPVEWQDIMPASRPDEGAPQVHLGPMVSGDKVIAKSEVLNELLDDYPKLIGVEMEAAGVANALYYSQHRPRFIMIRGVSDLADSEKETEKVKQWRSYACDVAVAFLRALLRQDLRPLLDQAKPASEKYEEDEQLYVDELASLEEELCKARISGRGVRDIQEQILSVRRELRAGPQLSEGGFLSNCRFELLERIGSGGFATVWRAIDRKASDLVAIKVLHSHLSSDKDRVARFERGASRMKRLGHPGIVRVLEEPSVEDGFRYYVMEFAGSVNLYKYVLAQSSEEATSPMNIRRKLVPILSGRSHGNSHDFRRLQSPAC